MKNPWLTVVAAMLMAGCSSQTSKPAQTQKPEPKPPEFVTARVAFQKLFIAAHGWARDAQPFRLESSNIPGKKGEGGKSASWRASFASAAQRSERTYSWSGADTPDGTARGITPGGEDSYTPGNASTQVFDMGFLKVDSDKALETAQKHGGDKLLAKTPDTSIFYVLDWSHLSNQLIWHVIYGPNPDEASLKVDVDASTGNFIRIEK
ncbi:MAG: hypothetical protein JOY93_06380 [Acidobacteriales bacterium]|nr:hypothetical protein [Terriglobales bacterium]